MKSFATVESMLPPINLNNLSSYVLAFVVAAWAVFWKGIALWRAIESKQKNWFIIILVLNSATLGLAEILYLFKFAKKRLTIKEMKTWIPASPTTLRR